MELGGNGFAYGAGQQRDLVVIGASAGGVDALGEVVQNLPPEFPAAVLVVLHVASTGTSVLPQILSRKGPLPAVFARDGDEIRRGQIFVAPADHHMLVHNGAIRLTQGPRENGHRPAIDPLFRSAARAAGERAIGVVLSGLLDDGASGLRFLKSSGGAAVVQDPDDALFPSMPNAAMALVHVDRVVPAFGMANALCALIEEPIEPAAEDTSVIDAEALPAEREIDDLDRVEIEDPAVTAALVSGPPTTLTCPECGGSLWEQVDGTNVRFAATSGMPIPSRAWSRSRDVRSRRRSGPPCARSRNEPTCTGASHGAPAGRAVSCTRPGRLMPRRTRAS